jgi:mannosyltransferase OCH1-like enzyme
MIPKIIHYCWFGGKPLDKLSLKCITSWKKMCPDYEIKLWNEQNYDVTQNIYMQQAYKSKKWGFVPDYARLDIIYKYGGIYLDTDVEILKPLDEFLDKELFMGMEEPGKVALGLGFGAEKENKIIFEMLNSYKDIEFIKSDGSYDLTPSPIIQTNIMRKHGLKENSEIQFVDGAIVYPPSFFCGFDFEKKYISITDDNYTVHHYSGSWLPWYKLIKKNIARKLRSTIFKK